MTTDLLEPYFSIIIPVYRDSDRLLQCLDAINQCRNEDVKFEVIVVNNDPEIEKLNLDLSLYSFDLKEVNEKKPGSYAARNKGISEANGEILAFTDSDCIPSTNWISEAYRQFKPDIDKKIGILTGPIPLFYKDPENLSDAEVYEKHTGFTTEAYAKFGHAVTANWFSHASVIREFGGFNPELKSNGDSELSGRISQKYSIVYSPDLIVLHPSRYHTEELVSKYKRLLGGSYIRRFRGDQNAFLKHMMIFVSRRYKFLAKRVFTIPVKESMAIFRVSNAINRGVIQEYFNLTKGGETKR